MGPDWLTLDRFSYPVPNGFTYESDPVWSCTVLGWYRARVNATRFRLTQGNRRPGRWAASLPCPVINAPNRNEAGIPALTHQDRPIEIVSLYVPFWFVCTEDRAQWFPVVRNMSQNCFQVLNGKFQETRWCKFQKSKNLGGANSKNQKI